MGSEMCIRDSTYTDLFSKIMTPKGFDRDPTTDAYVCLGKEIKVIYLE